ncbi:MAG: hypothetical protein AAF639_17115 [Chloroflexota bacterium]
MTLVRVIKDWDWPDIARQTPNHSGVWDGITFTTDAVEECDYVIVLNNTLETTTVTCPPEHIWSMIQEPPTEFRKAWHVNPPYAARMLTTDLDLIGPLYMQSQAALPWHVNQDYDFLSTLTPPEKPHQLSWITSRLRYFQGHRARMDFLDGIQGKLDIDLIATYEYYLRQAGATRESIAAHQATLGFVCVEDKWSGLAPYRYSIAVENYSNPLYWSEKLIDCYLAWCMPIYYGCTRLADYFPIESFIQIDIHQPDEAIGIIEEAIANHAWQCNQEAIAHARELILNRYQFFPFMARQIHHFETTYGAFSKKKLVTIEPRQFKTPLWRKAVGKAKGAVVRAQRMFGKT